ncbi:MAG: type VI secretion system tip protein TssI/VgrG, partial [Betaproteobacteria bacterium]
MDKNRIAQAHTPLSPTLMFRQFTGREEISRPFDWQLELLAEKNANIEPDALLGKDITIELKTQSGAPRFFNGQVTRFAFVGREVARESEIWRYEARLRPWLWYLTRESDFKIFQNKTVPEILDEVFAKYPYPVEKKLGGGHYRTWEYCVQYQETDFNFVSRLMEHEGIYYYFKHEMGRHTLVLANDLSKHVPCPGYDSVPYIPPDRAAIADEEYIGSWQIAKEVDSGTFITDDFDFKKPRAELLRPRMKPYSHPHGDHPIYEWPGGYVEVADGENYAKLRLEELQAPHESVTGEGNARGLAPGYLFTLKTCPRKDQNREYLILGMQYFVRDNPYHSGGEGHSDWRLLLTAQPTTVPYRPPRVTPKPLTNGPQTAVVVGKQDDEIYTDKYGRVKVQFHWDQYGQADENSSCWIRVSSPWAGNKWGVIFIPRVGQEVIVDFIAGDPDCPIITGRVYNAEHMPPYELDKYKEYSAIKSHSTKHGGETNWNELRFYDYKGKEQVFIHANWRMDVRVKWN